MADNQDDIIKATVDVDTSKAEAAFKRLAAEAIASAEGVGLALRRMDAAAGVTPAGIDVRIAALERGLLKETAAIERVRQLRMEGSLKDSLALNQRLAQMTDEQFAAELAQLKGKGLVETVTRQEYMAASLAAEKEHSAAIAAEMAKRQAIFTAAFNERIAQLRQIKTQIESTSAAEAASHARTAQMTPGPIAQTGGFTADKTIPVVTGAGAGAVGGTVASEIESDAIIAKAAAQTVQQAEVEKTAAVASGAVERKAVRKAERAAALEEDALSYEEQLALAAANQAGKVAAVVAGEEAQLAAITRGAAADVIAMEAGLAAQAAAAAKGAEPAVAEAAGLRAAAATQLKNAQAVEESILTESYEKQLAQTIINEQAKTAAAAAGVQARVKVLQEQGTLEAAALASGAAAQARAQELHASPAVAAEAGINAAKESLRQDNVTRAKAAAEAEKGAVKQSYEEMLAITIANAKARANAGRVGADAAYEALREGLTKEESAMFAGVAAKEYADSVGASKQVQEAEGVKAAMAAINSSEVVMVRETEAAKTAAVTQGVEARKAVQLTGFAAYAQADAEFAAKLASKASAPSARTFPTSDEIAANKLAQSIRVAEANARKFGAIAEEVGTGATASLAVLEGMGRSAGVGSAIAVKELDRIRNSATATAEAIKGATAALVNISNSTGSAAAQAASVLAGTGPVVAATAQSNITWWGRVNDSFKRGEDGMRSYQAQFVHFMRALGGMQNLTFSGVATIASNMGLIGVAVGGATLAISGLIWALDKFADVAEKITGVSTGFETLSERAGETAQTFISEIRPAGQGLVTDLDLMRQANTALLLGLPVTGNEMAKLTTGAIQLGRAMGVDAVKSIDSLVQGIGRQSPRLLDNIGIILKQTEVYKDYARSIHLTVDELTEEDKKAAFTTAALELLEKKTATMKVSNETLADSIHRVAVNWKNAANELINYINTHNGMKPPSTGEGEGGLPGGFRASRKVIDYQLVNQKEIEGNAYFKFVDILKSVGFEMDELSDAMLAATRDSAKFSASIDSDREAFEQFAKAVGAVNEQFSDEAFKKFAEDSDNAVARMRENIGIAVRDTQDKVQSALHKIIELKKKAGETKDPVALVAIHKEQKKQEAIVKDSTTEVGLEARLNAEAKHQEMLDGMRLKSAEKFSDEEARLSRIALEHKYDNEIAQATRRGEAIEAIENIRLAKKIAIDEDQERRRSARVINEAQNEQRIVDARLHVAHTADVDIERMQAESARRKADIDAMEQNISAAQVRSIYEAMTIQIDEIHRSHSEARAMDEIDNAIKVREAEIELAKAQNEKDIQDATPTFSPKEDPNRPSGPMSKETLDKTIALILQIANLQKLGEEDAYQRHTELEELKYQKDWERLAGDCLAQEALKKAHYKKVEADFLKHQQALAKIEKGAAKSTTETHKMSEEEKRNATMATMQAAASLISSAFAKNKAAQIGAAIINTAAAVVGALGQAPFGPWNIAMAAIVGAMGLVQIAKIRSATIDGGGSTSGVSSAPAINYTDPSNVQKEQTVTGTTAILVKANSALQAPAQPTAPPATPPVEAAAPPPKATPPPAVAAPAPPPAPPVVSGAPARPAPPPPPQRPAAPPAPPVARPGIPTSTPPPAPYSQPMYSTPAPTQSPAPIRVPFVPSPAASETKQAGIVHHNYSFSLPNVIDTRGFREFLSDRGIQRALTEAVDTWRART